MRRRTENQNLSAEDCRQAASILLELLAIHEEAAENTDENEPGGEYVHFPKKALQWLIESLQLSADSLDLSVQIQTNHSAILQTAVAGGSDSEADQSSSAISKDCS